MELDIKIEFQSGIPLNEQIAYQVLALIENGEIKPGDQLPSTRQLALKLGINFNTVARAYRILDQGSMISTQHGRGTFILEEENQKSTKMGDKKTIEGLTRFYLRKAAYLGFEPEEVKVCFERLALEEGQE
jgi:GntR family transcriptional regulator